MSWNWNADEEVVKQYETKGTVAISTEEYRDLIAQVFKLKAAGQKEHDEWYEEYNKRKDVEKELAEVKKRIADIETWLQADELAAANYKAYRLKKLEELEEENR